MRAAASLPSEVSRIRVRRTSSGSVAFARRPLRTRLSTRRDGLPRSQIRNFPRRRRWRGPCSSTTRRTSACEGVRASGRRRLESRRCPSRCNARTPYRKLAHSLGTPQHLSSTQKPCHFPAVGTRMAVAEHMASAAQRDLLHPGDIAQRCRGCSSDQFVVLGCQQQDGNGNPLHATPKVEPKGRLCPRPVAVRRRMGPKEFAGRAHRPTSISLTVKTRS